MNFAVLNETFTDGPKYLFLSSFFLKVEKLDKAEYEGPSDKSLFFLKFFLEIYIPYAPVISSKKMLLKNTSSVITVIQVLSVGPQKCCMVIYLK
jgi:hypothetical protein